MFDCSTTPEIGKREDGGVCGKTFLALENAGLHGCGLAASISVCACAGDPAIGSMSVAVCGK